MVDKVEEIINLIKNGDIKSIDLIINNKINIDSSDEQKSTFLMKASRYGHYNLVKKLILYKSNINKQCINGNTSLTLASKYGRVKIVKYLLKNDANVNLQNRNGYTALMIASTSYLNLNEIIINELLDYGANLYIKNNCGTNVLQMTSIQNCYSPLYNNCNCGYIKGIIENAYKKNLKTALVKYSQFPKNMLLIDLTNIIFSFIL